MTPVGSERALVAAVLQDPEPRNVLPTPLVRGRLVAAEDGSPLANVPLQAEFRMGDAPANAGRSERTLVTTAADGRFVVSCPATAVEVWVWFAVENRCRRWFQGAPVQSVDLGDIGLTKGGRVRGVLLDEEGRPMEGVRLCMPIAGEVPGPGGEFQVPCMTAADGSFSWKEELAAPGALEFRCKTPGIELVASTATIIAGAVPNLALLRGRRLPAIRGVVFGPGGEPVSGVDLEVFDPNGTPHSSTCGSGSSSADGSFEVFRTAGTAAEVQMRTSLSAAYELAGDPVSCSWGAGGLRIEVRPLIPVRLAVVEAGTDQPIEQFGEWTVRQLGLMELRTGGTNVTHHEQGRFDYAGLAAGTRIMLWASDPALAPVSLLVEESQRNLTPVVVPLARMQPFALTLVDARGRPVATAIQVVDPCGATRPEPCNDPRTFSSSPPSVAILLSAVATDANGAATLLAPVDRRELQVALKRNGRLVWVPLVLPQLGQAIRLVVPD